MRNRFMGLGAAALIFASVASFDAAPSAMGFAGPHAKANAGTLSGPQCGTVYGTGAVTYTRDEGKTLAPTSEPLVGPVNITGLTALETPGYFLAENNGSIIFSKDSGCSWTEIGTVDYSPVRLTAAGPTSAYAWSDNGNYFARIDRGGVTELRAPFASILGVGVDARDAKHVRAGGDYGSIVESFDGGDSWNRVAPGPPSDELTIVYRVEFDPTNLDHILIGETNSGAYMTTDGGRTWDQSRSNFNGPTNIFNFAISPADPNVVWAMGIYLPYTDQPWGGRYILRSTDGGRNFTAVYRETRKVVIRNGPVMAAHPTDPNVLYFVFGTYFSNYGTDIYKLNAGTNTLQIRHNQAEDVDAIAFHQLDPTVMYFGLEARGGGF